MIHGGGVADDSIHEFADADCFSSTKKTARLSRIADSKVEMVEEFGTFVLIMRTLVQYYMVVLMVVVLVVLVVALLINFLILMIS